MAASSKATRIACSTAAPSSMLSSGIGTPITIPDCMFRLPAAATSPAASSGVSTRHGARQLLAGE